MNSPDPRRFSRRDVLKYGLGGAAGLAVPLVANALPAAATSRSRTAAKARPYVVARRSAAVKKGGTLKFARSIAPTTLDPANTIIAGDIYTLDKIIEPLYVTSPAGDLTPWLATGYTLSADRKTYTFNLRRGVKFSDGRPLVADDVVFSINRARLDSAGPLSFLDYAIKSIESSGTDKVVMHLSSPWAPFISDISVFANGIMPANFGGKSEKDYLAAPDRNGAVHDQLLHPRRAVAQLEGQPPLLAGRQAVPRRGRIHLRRQRHPAGAPAARSARWTSSTSSPRRALPRSRRTPTFTSMSSPPGRSTCSS